MDTYINTHTHTYACKRTYDNTNLLSPLTCAAVSAEARLARRHPRRGQSAARQQPRDREWRPGAGPYVARRRWRHWCLLRAPNKASPRTRGPAWRLRPMRCCSRCHIGPGKTWSPTFGKRLKSEISSSSNGSYQEPRPETKVEGTLLSSLHPPAIQNNDDDNDNYDDTTMMVIMMLMLVMMTVVIMMAMIMMMMTMMVIMMLMMKMMVMMIITTIMTAMVFLVRMTMMMVVVFLMMMTTTTTIMTTTMMMTTMMMTTMMRASPLVFSRRNQNVLTRHLWNTPKVDATCQPTFLDQHLCNLRMPRRGREMQRTLALVCHGFKIRLVLKEEPAKSQVTTGTHEVERRHSAVVGTIHVTSAVTQKLLGHDQVSAARGQVQRRGSFGVTDRRISAVF